MNPQRIAQLRSFVAMLRREHTTDGQDDVIEELLTEVERLTSAARSAAVLLRAIDAHANAGRPQDVTAIRAAAAALDEAAST